MSTQSELRAAFEQLAAAAPPVAVLDPTSWQRLAVEDADQLVSLPDDVVVAGGPAPVGRRRVRRRDWTVVAVVASVAAVVVVITGVAVFAGSRSAPPAQPAASPPVSSEYATQYMFGPDSVPGYQLAYAELDTDMQSYVYEQGTAGIENDDAGRGMDLYSFIPTAVVQASLTQFTPTKVSGARAYYGTFPVTDSGLKLLFEPPSSKHTSKVDALNMSMIVWPLDGVRWAALLPWGEQGDTMAEPALASLADSVQPNVDDHAALVRVGYLPAGLRFASAEIRPPLPCRYEQARYEASGACQPAADGTVGRGSRTLSLGFGSLEPGSIGATWTPR